MDLKEETADYPIRTTSDNKEAATLIENHERYLKKIIFGILRNPEDAEDAYQEISHKLFQAFSSWQGPVFKSWAARIAVNHCIDLKAKRNRENDIISLEHLEESGRSESVASLDTTSRSPEEILEERENIAEIRRIIAELPEPVQEILDLYYKTDLTMKEIAEKLQLNQRTVETRIYRARKEISKKWRNHAH